MIRVQPAPAEHLPWLAQRARLQASPALRALEAVDASGAIVAMFGFDGWVGNACQVHIACENPLALRKLLIAAAGLAFDPKPRGLGLAAVIAPVVSTNKESLRFVRHCGWREFHVGRDWMAPGVDLHWFEMRPEFCRFLPRNERRAA